jgi:O-acetyl-ADP-ribose deacetylase (regulator of RNase III)
MIPILYLKGDAVQPQGAGPKIIAHICNDIGKWGRGFVLALSARSTKPEKAFKRWFAERASDNGGNDFALGAMQLVAIEDELWVANMIGQHKVATKGGGAPPPIRYDAVQQALAKLRVSARELNATVHMPRIGCGLAGGTWDRIEPLIDAELCAHDVQVVVYDFE